MEDKCPICKTDLLKHEKDSRNNDEFFNCPLCGNFSLTYIAFKEISSLVKDSPNVSAILSHSIRKMQKKVQCPYLKDDMIKAIVENSKLPSPYDQLNNFIIWLYEKGNYGDNVLVKIVEYQSIIGSKDFNEACFVFESAVNKVLLTTIGDSANIQYGESYVKHTFYGWEMYDEIKRGAVDSRKVFMAMKFNDIELDKFYEAIKPAVEQTGFELFRTDKKPKAGSIDDRIRVEIRNSRFLIADLTNDNSGAYWEAGFAEGLGKPVIYTCLDDQFEKIHFDTNHLTTVKWKSEDYKDAIEDLKAIIRNTLPDEAKMQDD